MKKKWLVSTIAVVLLVIANMSIAFSDTSLKIIVNDKELIPDVPLKIINGTVMVPATWLAQSLGADVKWDEPNRTVTITKESGAENTLSAVFQNVADKFQGRLTGDESVQRRYYPLVPEKITTPEMALQAYFDALSVAANLTMKQMNAAGGTIGMGLEPYPSAYGYWSREWQDKNSYSEFLNSWEGTANVELLKLLFAGEEGGQKRFFVETRHLEVVEDPPRVGQFYYAGFFTVSETAEGWKITGGELEPQSLEWKLGGHQPWRADPETVAFLELEPNIDEPLGKAVTDYNTDGTADVRFIDSEGNETHMAVLVQREDGIWQVLYTHTQKSKKLIQADLKDVFTDEYKNDSTNDVRVEVLLYHELAPGGSTEWPVIDPQDFYTQIDLLLDHGWQPLTLDKFAAWLRGEKKVEEKSFLLTFDDGGESIYHYAYPFLLEKGIPATIFLIGKHHDPNYHMNEIIWVSKLTDQQIKEMAGSGLIQFQSHSYNLHRKIQEKPAAIVLSPPDVLEDFRKSAKVLEELTGQGVFSIAYPGGNVNQRVIKLAAGAGFELGFAGNIRGSVNKTQPMSIKRYPLDNISLNAFMHYYGCRD